MGRLAARTSSERGEVRYFWHCDPALKKLVEHDKPRQEHVQNLERDLKGCTALDSPWAGWFLHGVDSLKRQFNTATRP
jgi:hypothetical protein